MIFEESGREVRLQKVKLSELIDPSLHLLFTSLVGNAQPMSAQRLCLAGSSLRKERCDKALDVTDAEDTRVIKPIYCHRKIAFMGHTSFCRRQVIEHFGVQVR